MKTYYLACDLGAESGRVMLGALSDGRLELRELHRFPNTPLKVDGALHWDIPRLLESLKTGLQKAAALSLPIASISTDSWGVDYMLYDQQKKLMSPTFHYRDSRTARGVEAVKARVDWETIFAETGIQFMTLNSIYQLAAESPERLAQARLVLLIGDAFNYYLCGVAKAEVSLASTTQLYNPRTLVWSKTLLDQLGIPEPLFPEIIPSGTRLGRLTTELMRETGINAMEVIASCSHDTGAAVAAVPASGEHWAYLSSGTWSLMGVELAAPIITNASRELNFTNEIGFGGTVRLLKNIIGLWLVQECRRHWSSEGKDYDYATLAKLAGEAPAFVSLINPGDARFVSPDNMPARIAAYCRETGQPEPATPGAMIRCILESLALFYRRTLLQVEQIIGHKVERLHIVGGGSQNVLLNQFAANAMQIPVLTGPVEATAAGNILVQAIALGHLPSLSVAREVVRRSFEMGRFEPKDSPQWTAAYERLQKLMNP